jgi:hypothetical protein
LIEGEAARLDHLSVVFQKLQLARRQHQHLRGHEWASWRSAARHGIQELIIEDTLMRGMLVNHVQVTLG